MEPMNLASLGKAEFKMGGGEFIPKGKMVATSEQFPDLDALDAAPKQSKKGKKGKKKQVVVANTPVPVIEDEVDDGTPWKGKKAAFFEMKVSEKHADDETNPQNFDMNPEQWNFIFKHYPEFGHAPFEMMIWLYG